MYGRKTGQTGQFCWLLSSSGNTTWHHLPTVLMGHFAHIEEFVEALMERAKVLTLYWTLDPHNIYFGVE